MKKDILIVDFENEFGLYGLPFVYKQMDNYQPVGMLARGVDQQVKDDNPDLPFFEKKVSLQFLLNFHEDWVIDNELLDHLSVYEDQIFYHINRYFDTTLAYDYSLVRYKCVLYCLDIIQSTNPELIYFGVTPHDPISYLVYLIGKYKKLPTPMITRWHLLSGYVIYDEIGKTYPFVKGGAPLTPPTENLPKVNGLLDSIITKEPYYMVKQKKEGKSFIRKVKTSVLKNKRVSLTGIRRYQEKQKLKQNYEERSTVNTIEDLGKIKKPIVFVPLHYQPELTTSPEGNYYAQQWLLIQRLNSLLGNDYLLLVKEHPTQFLVGSKKVRSSILYEAIQALGSSVQLCSIKLSSQEILKVCKGVATITGTVGLEAILNEKPAYVFGDAKYNGVTGTFNPLNDPDLKGFSGALESGEPFSAKQVREDFESLLNSRFYEFHEPTETHEERHMRIMKKLLGEYLNHIQS